MADDESFEALLNACGEGATFQGRTAAFALVTAYDHDVSELEIGRYVEFMLDDAPGSPRKLGEAFGRLAEAMKADLEGATAFVSETLQALREDEVAVAAAVKAARIAAVADTALERREEAALRAIGEALGVDATLI